MAEEAVRRVPWAQVKREATVLTETRRSVARVAVAVRAIPRRLVAPEEMEVHGWRWRWRWRRNFDGWRWRFRWAWRSKGVLVVMRWL